MRESGPEKARLREQIEEAEEQLHDALAGSPAPRGSVDWRVEFAEVFDLNGGFDIALANPPYVRADAQFKHLEDQALRQRAIDRWKAYRSALTESKTYKTLYEKWDLYIPFLERAYQTLTGV